MPTESTRKGAIGKPGISPKPISSTADRIRGCGLLVSCSPISCPTEIDLPTRRSSATRVTSTPAAMQISSDGICDTIASPMDSTVKRSAAWPAVMFMYITPMAMPPRMLMAVITRPAMASPLTNFIAPSMPPCSALSMPSRSRRARAASPVIMPARRSASMLICLPGSASSVNRAPTSATRSEPLAMTMNWTIVMMMNTTKPTTMLPPTTRLPKASITWPASAVSRMTLVDAMFSARRNMVVNSSSVGKVESSTTLGTYITTISSSALIIRFTASSVSISISGTGTMISASTVMMSTPMPTSPPKRLAVFIIMRAPRRAAARPSAARWPPTPAAARARSSAAGSCRARAPVPGCR